MNKEMKESKLKVMEALQEEAYKGIVRIDSETIHVIGVRPGDIIEIEGQRKTVGIVDRAYPTDVGQQVIRMDGIIRRNAKTSIGETVAVRKAAVAEAKSITIAPSQQGIMIQASPELFRRGLLGRSVLKGDIISLGGARRRRRTMEDTPFEEIFNVFEEGFMGSFGLPSLKFVVVDSIPSLVNISGCFKGSSTISLTFFISSSNPPKSSYVTSGIFSSETSIAFCVTVMLVFSEIITACFGLESTTTNFNEGNPNDPINPSSKTLKISSNGVSSIVLLRLLAPPKEIMSPLRTDLPSKPLLNNSGDA